MLIETERIHEVVAMLDHAANDMKLSAESLRNIMDDAKNYLKSMLPQHDPLRHNTESEGCFCNPTIETDPVTGDKVVIHNDAPPSIWRDMGKGNNEK